MRETIEQKVTRLLATGCVRVVGPTAALVKGDHDTYALVLNGIEWDCTCIGHQMRHDCSHARAVGRVTPVPDTTAPSRTHSYTVAA